MAILSEEQVKQIIKTGRLRELREADAHEARLQLHTRTTIDIPDINKDENINNSANSAFWDFMTLPKAALPPDKYNTFKTLMTFPLPTVEVVERANDELFKVFHAQNSVTDLHLKDQELKKDFEEYLKESLNEEAYWPSKGWDHYKNEINGMIIVDLPRLEQDPDTGQVITQTERPEPYFYFLPTKRIHSVENNSSGDCEYVIFTQPLTADQKEREVTLNVFVLDDLAYKNYEVFEDDKIVLVTDSAHDLGYTPARMFWSTPLNNSKIQKKNQTSANLGALDWLLYSKVTQRHLDLYAGFPIISVFEQECTYRGNAWFCQDGFLHHDDPSYDENVKQRIPCPKCNSGRNLIGPGSVLEAPGAASNPGENPSNQMPMLQITEGDTASIETIEKKIRVQESELMANMVGLGGEPINNQAVNEKQVLGSFESRTIVLNKLARNFEKIRSFTIDTIGRLRYGSDQYLGSHIFFGSVFFLHSLEDMQKDLDAARNNGMPNFDLAQRRKNMWSKQFHNNPEMLLRTRMLSDLEPLEDYDHEKLLKYEKYISKDQIILKINFNDILQDFELVEGPIQEYLPDLDYELRVIQIRQFFKEKVEEILEQEQEPVQEQPPSQESQEGQEGQEGAGSEEPVAEGQEE